MYTWGDNFLGKLGQGREVMHLGSPRRVSGGDFARKTTKDVACGTWHTAAVVERRRGDKDNGASTSSPTPSVSSKNSSPGGERTNGTTTSPSKSGGGSSLYVWGSDEKRCLGLGSDSERAKTTRWLPCAVLGQVSARDLVQVSCGQCHTLVLSDRGQVFQAGRAGPLTTDEGFEEINVQHESICQIACGLHHCVVVNNKRSKVYTWGQGKEGQLGHDFARDVSEPKSVAKLANRRVLDVQCGDYYTLSVCSHIDYDDAKVERQLRRAREKFQMVVGTKAKAGPGLSSSSPEDKKGLDLAKKEHKAKLVSSSRARAKSKSVIKMLKHYVHTKRKSSLTKGPKVDGGFGKGGSGQVKAGPSQASEKKKGIINVESTLDVMTKLGDGINKARSLSSHARDDRVLDAFQTKPQATKVEAAAAASAAQASGDSSSPLEGQSSTKTSFLTIFKEGKDMAKVPNMERLAKRIVDLERQVSLSQQQAPRPSVPQTPARMSEGGIGPAGGPAQQQQDKENDSSQSNLQHQPHTPTHSRNSTWSFDLSNDVDSQNFARIRKQSQSLESFATPIGPNGGVVVANGEKRTDATLVHLAAQNKRLKQKLREMESRLKQQTAAGKEGPAQNAAPSTPVPAPTPGRSAPDSVALSCVEVVPGVKVFVRSMRDRTELYKVAYEKENEAAFVEWFANSKVDFMRDQGITHIDVSALAVASPQGGSDKNGGLKEEFLDMLNT